MSDDHDDYADFLDLARFRRKKADEFLRLSPNDQPLCPCAIEYWRRLVCVPIWVIDELEREEQEKER